MIRIRPAAIAILMCVGLLLPGGCAHAVKTAVPNPIEIDPSEYGRVFQASVDVLHAEGFTIAREDYRFGRVTSMPLASPTLLEPWKTVNTTTRQAAEATVNAQRRIVTIRIDPSYAAAATTSTTASPAPTTQPVAAYHLRVDVEVQQAQFPNRRLSGSTSGPAIINVLHETPTELREQGIHGAYWQSVDSDRELEQRILAAVVRASVDGGERQAASVNGAAGARPPETPAVIR